MLSWFSSDAPVRRTALKLYGAIVTQSRQPVFFAGHGVSDTPEGRTDMIILHLFMVLDRLQKVGPEASRLARVLSEIFVTDVDDSLREMGVGDMSVPKKVKRAAQALGERCRAYRGALAAEPRGDQLASELASTVPGLVADKALELAQYVIAGRARLAAMSDENLLAGNAAFPDPSPAA